SESIWNRLSARWCCDSSRLQWSILSAASEPVKNAQSLTPSLLKNGAPDGHSANRTHIGNLPRQGLFPHLQRNRHRHHKVVRLTALGLGLALVVDDERHHLLNRFHHLGHEGAFPDRLLQVRQDWLARRYIGAPAVVRHPRLEGITLTPQVAVARIFQGDYRSVTCGVLLNT